MKWGQLNNEKGDPILECILHLSPDETMILNAALKEYVDRNPRLRKAKKLNEDFHLITIFM